LSVSKKHNFFAGCKIHYPWNLTVSDARICNFTLGNDYPKPIVMAPEWARHYNKKPASEQRRPAEGGGKRRQRGVDFYFKNTDAKK
jgi:deoxyribodipyrimidine photo-lyase